MSEHQCFKNDYDWKAEKLPSDRAFTKAEIIYTGGTCILKYEQATYLPYATQVLGKRNIASR